MAVLTVIAGFSNALLVLAVNNVAGEVADAKSPGLLGCLMFAGAFLIYYVCDRYSLLRANSVVERQLKLLRLDIISRLRQSEVKAVEGAGQGALVKVVSQETNHLSVAFPILVDSFQQLVLLLVALVYLCYLSMFAFGIFAGGVVVGMLGYVRFNRKFKASITLASARQTDMIDRISDIINGGKEMRLSTMKSESVFQLYRQLSDETEVLVVDAGRNLAKMILLANIVTYGMLGTAVFVLPHHVQHSEKIIFQLVPTLLFCTGPLGKILAQLSMFVRAELGLASINEINAQFGQNVAVLTENARKAALALNGFKRIDYRNITYSYQDRSGENSFTSGPWDLHLNRGELVFLVGGNGSGKSTALRLITGLYHADGGNIAVDGKVLDEFTFVGLREQFSAIFGNFHLFDRLYGLEDIDADTVKQLINDMELTGKVEYENGRFIDLNLSTGQRKRLALIAALLEDRPVYAFDEWAAEQDVHFREVFYRKILPQLKQQGKTVVAVTHDERYWELADRIVRFDQGRIQWEQQSKQTIT
ncbi:cyclic peptide export ABC transporter [Glaciimonas sp. GNP009]